MRLRRERLAQRTVQALRQGQPFIGAALGLRLRGAGLDVRCRRGWSDQRAHDLGASRQTGAVLGEFGGAVYALTRRRVEGEQFFRACMTGGEEGERVTKQRVESLGGL